MPQFLFDFFAISPRLFFQEPPSNLWETSENFRDTHCFNLFHHVSTHWHTHRLKMLCISPSHSPPVRRERHSEAIVWNIGWDCFPNLNPLLSCESFQAYVPVVLVLVIFIIFIFCYFYFRSNDCHEVFNHQRCRWSSQQ